LTGSIHRVKPTESWRVRKRACPRPPAIGQLYFGLRLGCEIASRTTALSASRIFHAVQQHRDKNALPSAEVDCRWFSQLVVDDNRPGASYVDSAHES
jgi:hypothetical protein